jgi:hypothetical protein
MCVAQCNLPLFVRLNVIIVMANYKKVGSNNGGDGKCTMNFISGFG